MASGAGLDVHAAVQDLNRIVGDTAAPDVAARLLVGKGDLGDDRRGYEDRQRDRDSRR
jgi:hypothetical protein